MVSKRVTVQPGNATPVSSQSLHLLRTRWNSSCFPKPMNSASAAALHRGHSSHLPLKIFTIFFSAPLIRFSNPTVASTYYPRCGTRRTHKAYFAMRHPTDPQGVLIRDAAPEGPTKRLKFSERILNEPFGSSNGSSPARTLVLAIVASSH